MREPQNPVLAPLIRAFDEATQHTFFERVDGLLAQQDRVYPVEAEAVVFIEMRAEARGENRREPCQHSGTEAHVRL